MTSKPAQLSQEEKTLGSDHLEAFKQCLNNWANVSLKAEKSRGHGFLRIHQHIRHLQEPPAPILESITRMQDPVFDLVCKGLTGGTFNWFTCPKGNNTTPMRQRVIKNMMEEAYLHLQMRKDLVETKPELMELRLMLLNIIQSTSGLEDFKPWTTFTLQVEEEEPATYEDDLVIQNNTAMAADILDQQVDKAMQHLVNTLAKAGTGGVRVKEGESDQYRVHPALGKHLVALYKAS